MGVEDSYDAVAEAYATQFSDELDRKPFDRDLLIDMASRVVGPVADIGCGPGHIGRVLFDHGVDVVGIDRSEGMLRVARTAHPGMRFERADVRSLPFADGALGGAVAFYSLIHLDSIGDLNDALAELHRVIRPAGVLVVAVHEGEGSRHRDEWYGHAIDLTARFWSQREITDAMDAAGFTVESAIVREQYEGELTDRLYVTATRRR